MEAVRSGDAGRAGSIPGAGYNRSRMTVERDAWLTADDDALLAQCAIDTYRASGPGGQKRNKTSSAVRLRHGPSGLMVIAEESRSQHENKAKALRRLRLAIALRCRDTTSVGGAPPAWLRDYAGSRSDSASAAAGRMSHRNPLYPRLIALLLDALAASGGRVSDAAQVLDLTTARLGKLLAADGAVLAEANRIRAAAGLAALRA